MSPRILVVYPYSNNIDWNPTMCFLLESLAERKVAVDVLLPRSGDCLSSTSFGTSIQFKYVASTGFFYTNGPTLRSLARMLLELLRRRSIQSTVTASALPGWLNGRKYSVVVGVDPEGILFAHDFNRFAKRPLVYISFEIIFPEDVSHQFEETLCRLERRAAERSTLVLIQDDERAAAFGASREVARSRIMTLPAAPRPQWIEKSDYLRATLGIPAEKRIVLYCGSLWGWASRDELVEMLSYWPDRFCLVVHSDPHGYRNRGWYLRSLTETGKVYVSSGRVASRDFPSLVASADFGLAPYKPIPDNWTSGLNLYHLGLSSTKVSYYAMCGLPILARSLPVFNREFAEYACGRVYERVADTGEMLAEMDLQYERYSHGAVRFYRERLDPTSGMQKFCDALLRLAGVAS